MPNIPPEERDRFSPVWDMSQERAFLENLLGQRFNFFIVFFSLVIGGSINAGLLLHLQIVLTLGTIICCMLAISIFRSQQKLDIILADLGADETHPIAVVNAKAGGPSVRRLIGYAIPSVCCIALLIGAVLAFLGKIPIRP